MSKQLPPNPHLDVLKKQARQLLNAFQAEEPEAFERIEQALPDLPPSAREVFTLRQAQQVVAHEYDFSSWQKLAQHVDQSQEEREGPSFLERCEWMAPALIAQLQAGNCPQIVSKIQRFFPQYLSRSEDEIKAAFSVEQALAIVASEYGFDSWDALVANADKYQYTNIPSMHKEHLSGLEAMHSALLKPWTASFSAAGHAVQHVDIEPVFTDQTTYWEFANSLSDSSCVFTIDMNGMDGQVVGSIGPNAVVGLLGLEVAAGEAITEADMQRMQPMVEHLARDVEHLWQPIKTVSVRSVQIYADAFSTRATGMHEVIGLLAFQVKTKGPKGESSGIVELCYPNLLLEEFFPELSQHPQA
jgi:predicted transcriptional regulator